MTMMTSAFSATTTSLPEVDSWQHVEENIQAAFLQSCAVWALTKPSSETSCQEVERQLLETITLMSQPFSALIKKAIAGKPILQIPQTYICVHVCVVLYRHTHVTSS